MLQEVYDRYRRPLFVAETGIEDETRPAWLRYICKEVFTALEAGVPVEGICLYPIVNHPGWDDDRHCYNGMFDYADADGRTRAVSAPGRRTVASAGQYRGSRVRGRDGHRHQRSGYHRARLGRARHAGADGREPNLIVALGAN